MSARQGESGLLEFCAGVARDDFSKPGDKIQANVCRVAAMLLRTDYPEASKRLDEASDAYFTLHPEDLVSSEDVLNNGWIIGLPRFKDLLSRKLSGFLP